MGRSEFHQKLIDSAKVIFILGLVLAAIITILDVLFLAFAGVLLAVMLTGLTKLLGRATGFRHGINLFLVILALLGLVSGLILFIGPTIVEQANALLKVLPESLRNLQSQLSRISGNSPLLADVQLENLVNPSQMLKTATGVLSGLFGALIGALVLIFIGLFLAAEPKTYRKGLLYLVPEEHRDRTEGILKELYRTLTFWLLGRLVNMVFTGTFVAIGLLLLDVPLAFTLALISASITFVPYIGPILGAIPSVLVAFTVSPSLALAVLILFVVVENVEGYLITPLVDRKMVYLPPALTIFAQISLSYFIGPIGLALAAPFAASLMVITKRLYVEDTLGYQLPAQA